MSRAGALLVVAACAAVGCGSRDSERSAGSPAGGSEQTNDKETRVFQVKSSEDLVVLRSEYMRLWESGWDGLLEVEFGPGPYTAAGWDLGPAPDSGRKTAAASIDLVLRGASVAPPPPANVAARSVRIEGLIFKIEYGSVELAVRDSLAMRGCLVVDGRGMEHGRMLVSIVGVGDHGSEKARPVRVTVEESWFVRNFQGRHPGPMIVFGSAATAPTYFESIAITDSAFLGNAFTTELEVQFAKQMTISRSLFYKTWPDGVLLSSTSSGDIVLEDSIIFVEDPAHIARHGDESPPIKLAPSTRVYPKVGAGAARPPAGLTAEPGQFRDRASVAAGEDIIAEAARMPATIIPGRELKAKLDAALPPPN